MHDNIYTIQDKSDSELSAIDPLAFLSLKIFVKSAIHMLVGYNIDLE